MLEGRPTLLTGLGPRELAPGMCIGFKAGDGNAHHLANGSDADVVLLEIGDRTAGDEVEYPDDDIRVVRDPDGGWTFVHKDGTPFEG